MGINIKYNLVIVFSFFLFLLNACNKEKRGLCHHPKNKDCLEKNGYTNIRIKNNTKYNFCDLVLQGGEADVLEIGEIKSGEYSCYTIRTGMTEGPHVSVKLKGKTFIIESDIHRANTLLNKGKYTFTIQPIAYDGSKLGLHLNQD